MVERWLAAFGMALLALSAPAEDPEFAATAPAKVLLPVESPAVTPAETDTPVPVVPTPAPADNSGSASNPADSAAPSKEATDDNIAADISAEMDRQDSAKGVTSPSAANPPAADSSLSSQTEMVGRVLVSLCATVVGILLIYAALKRWGKRTPLLAGQQLAKVIGRVGLSPQASLHFVRTNGEVLVLGVTQQQVSLLRTFDAADFETTTEAPAPAGASAATDPAASFLAQLKATRASMSAEAAADEDLDQLKGELQRLKQYFQDSTRARD